MSSETFYPYITVPEGIVMTMEMSDPDVHRRGDGSWDATGDLVEGLKINIGLELGDGLLEQVLPPTELSAGSTNTVWVLITAETIEGRRRQGWSFDLEEVASGAVELNLVRAEWVGTVHLEAVLVRAMECRDPVEGFAAAVASRLAWSLPERILFDAPGRLPPGGRLDIYWTSFSEGNERLRRYRKHLFALEYTDLPKLLLNEDVPRAKLILSNRGTRGRHPRIRDATFMQIAHQVWSSLLASSLVALRSVPSSDADLDASALLEEIPEPWRAAVLRDWARFIFPEMGDQDGAISRLVEEARAPAMDELLVYRMPDAIQERLQTWIGFEGLAKEFGVALREEVAHD